MGTNEQQEKNSEVWQMVLTELAEEQRTNAQVVSDLVKAVNGLTRRIDELIPAVSKGQQASADAVVYETQVKLIGKDIATIKGALGERQPVIHEKRFLLFPEQDRKLFYKIVFGRWCFYLLLMLMCNNLYKWAVHNSDKRQVLKLEQIEHDHVNRAWQELYRNCDKNGKRLMEKAYQQSK